MFVRDSCVSDRIPASRPARLVRPALHRLGVKQAGELRLRIGLTSQYAAVD